MCLTFGFCHAFCTNISLPLPIKYVCARDIMHFKLFYRISMKFNTAQHPEWPMHRQVAKHEMICLLMLATCRYTNSTHFCNLILQKSVRYSCSQFRILNAWLTVFLFIYIADIYRYQFLAWDISNICTCCWLIALTHVKLKAFVNNNATYIRCIRRTKAIISTAKRENNANTFQLCSIEFSNSMNFYFEKKLHYFRFVLYALFPIHRNVHCAHRHGERIHRCVRFLYTIGERNICPHFRSQFFWCDASGRDISINNCNKHQLSVNLIYKQKNEKKRQIVDICANDLPFSNYRNVTIRWSTFRWHLYVSKFVIHATTLRQLVPHPIHVNIDEYVNKCPTRQRLPNPTDWRKKPHRWHATHVV